MKILNKILVLILSLAVLREHVFALAQITPPNVPSDEAQYRTSIEEKNKELEAINGQIKETQDNLVKIDGQKKSLSSELKKIDYTINQVNLGIKSSEINIQKLNLELGSLSDKVEEIEIDIALKKEAIVETIKQINVSDRGGMLQTLLKNESLVKGAFEVQALIDVQAVLSLNVDQLEDLHKDLTAAINEKETKKSHVEKENQNLKVRKNLAVEQKTERATILSETKNKETLYQQQLSALQKLQESIAEEIQDLEAALRGKIDADQIPAPRPGVLGNPVPGGKLTQGYGQTSFALRNYPGKWHNGLDFGKFLGAEIVSAEEGRVVATGNQDKFCYRGAYGKFVVVKHYNGLTTMYAHLSGYIVNVGDEVKRGSLIGYMGKTGFATGPHLHLVVYDSSTFRMQGSRSCGPMPIGGDIDPGNYLLL